MLFRKKQRPQPYKE